MMFSLQTMFGQGRQFYALLEDAAVAAHDAAKALHAMLKEADRQPALDAFKLARLRERYRLAIVTNGMVTVLLIHWWRRRGLRALR